MKKFCILLSCIALCACQDINDGFDNFDVIDAPFEEMISSQQGDFDKEELEGEGFVYRKGALCPPRRKESPEADQIPTVFCSWPLNPDASGDPETDVCERGRLKFSADAIDFFSKEGAAGTSASNRIRGVVLHDILSRVVLPEDLRKAVTQSVLEGDLTAEEGQEVYELLSTRIEEVRDRGWFPPQKDAVMNEVSLIDTDGSIYRPDRVICDGGRVIIVDYKFGEHDRRYLRQVRKYAEIWKRMGWSDVSAVLWYVQQGDIVQA